MSEPLGMLSAVGCMRAESLMFLGGRGEVRGGGRGEGEEGNRRCNFVVCGVVMVLLLSLSIYLFLFLVLVKAKDVATRDTHRRSTLLDLSTSLHASSFSFFSLSLPILPLILPPFALSFSPSHPLPVYHTLFL